MVGIYKMVFLFVMFTKGKYIFVIFILLLFLLSSVFYVHYNSRPIYWAR